MSRYGNYFQPNPERFIRIFFPARWGLRERHFWGPKIRERIVYDDQFLRFLDVKIT
jgi:hypothetical protein